MNFSQRSGIEPIKDVIQIKGMDSDLRVSLWNVMDQHIWSRRDFEQRGYEIFSINLWSNFFKRPIDTIPGYKYQVISEVREYFFNLDWNKVYDFIEFVLQACPNYSLDKRFNSILERELAGYRIIDAMFVQITGEEERRSIEEAITLGPYDGVKIHMEQALKHLSNRDNPDYRNSIKESISAVESLASELSGKSNATLGEALKILDKDGLLHPAMKKSFNALYGYTSDADGIRHSMMEKSGIDATDAKYFLISCSSFTNYLITKYGK